MKKIITNSIYCIITLLFIESNIFAQPITINHVAGPIILNEPFYDSLHQLNINRGLFTDVIVKGNSVWTTYQIAPDTTLSIAKSIWYKKFDRELTMSQGQTVAINVFTDTLFDDDLADHQITMMNDKFYIVALIKGHEQAAVMVYDTSFQTRLKGPIFIGDTTTDAFLDMGIGNDGLNIYTQFYHVPDTSTNPDSWAAKIYKLDSDLNVLSSNVVDPQPGSFVTGTSIVHVPTGQMGSNQDKLQIFSTNKDYMNSQTIGIHTFSADTSLQYINGSTQTIIQEDRDTYWPCGVSFNQAHQLWVVGYTKESSSGVFPTEEIGPSFMKVFDPNWNVIDSFQLNLGNNAFRVMTETIGNDIYVVYDEMPYQQATSTVSSSKIEHYKINSTTNITNNSKSLKNITIYPNPSSGKYFINGLVGDVTMQLYNSQGQLIKDYNKTNNIIEIKKNGIYLLKLKCNNQTITKKIIKY